MFVTEYLNGGELYGKLKSLKRFKEEQAATVLKCCCEALYYLHRYFPLFYPRKGIVHRDLKLENVLLISNSKFEVKLIDFGFAEKINKNKLVSKAGTPGYLPPEIFKL